MKILRFISHTYYHKFKPWCKFIFRIRKSIFSGAWDRFRCFILGKKMTEYFGEFGYELTSVIPYAYLLYLHKKLYITRSAKQSKCFYYFSPRHREIDVRRDFQELGNFPIVDIHIPYLDTSRWAAPPYKKVFKNDRFLWNKPICVVNNKYTVEWDHSPSNFLSVDVLRSIFELLIKKYQVIYNRPLPGEIVPDHQTNLEFGDFDLIKVFFPQVITMKQLHGENCDLTWNELALMVFSNCDNFISVQGGNSIFASYFGGTNIIFAKEGKELAVDAYQNWYNKFSGCQVIHVDNYEDLISEIRTRYL